MGGERLGRASGDEWSTDWSNDASAWDTGAESVPESVPESDWLDDVDPWNDRSKVAGDPDAAAAVWHLQETPTTCAVASQEFVLREEGLQVTEAELTDYARQRDWYRPGAGTPQDRLGSLLEANGVPVDRRSGASVDQLREALERGDRCLVAVNAEALDGVRARSRLSLRDWRRPPGQNADHAVEVTGVDDRVAGETTIVLNDPGVPAGAGRRVRLEDFERAWAGSDRYLVTTRKEDRR